jgi:hypothetical protein
MALNVPVYLTTLFELYESYRSNERMILKVKLMMIVVCCKVYISFAPLLFHGGTEENHKLFVNRGRT